MMDWLRAILLGILQGATEFLPISSSGHLVLIPWFLNWPEPGVVYGAMVHWGTLVAVVTYFREDIRVLARGWLTSLRTRQLDGDPHGRLAWLILLASLPAGLAGFLFEDFFEALFSQPGWAATFLLVTGSLLVGSEHLSRRRSLLSSTGNPHPDPAVGTATWLSLSGALWIGLAQAAAIAPGISRSGVTIAAGLLVGLGRQEAARFSFLLAIPVIFGAGLLQLLKLALGAAPLSQLPVLIIGFAAACLTGYLAIRFFLVYLQRHSLWVFAIYCWILGLLGLAVYVLL